MVFRLSSIRGSLFFLLYGVALRICCANCFVYTSGFLFVCCECLMGRKCFENSLLVPFFSQWVRFQKGVPRTYDFAARFKVSCGSAADPKGGKSHAFFRLDPLICCPHSVDQRHVFAQVLRKQRLRKRHTGGRNWQIWHRLRQLYTTG